MKILFLTSSLAQHFGGAAFSESALCSQLAKDNDVTILSRVERLDPVFAQRQGLKDVRGFKPFEVLLAFLFSKHWLANEIKQADVFHLNGHWFWENYFFARLCHRNRVPYILHPRGMLWVSYRKPRVKKLFNLVIGNWIVQNASKVILLSKFEKGHCKPYKVESTKLVIIPNGISSVSTHELVPAEPSYFLYLGRIEPRKNLEFLIRAFLSFGQNEGSIVLRLVGPVEKEYDSVVLGLINKLGLSDRVFLEPPKYGLEKDQLVANALAVVYPAFEETFGRTVFEAFASGTVCLLPDASGGAEYVMGFAPEVIYRAKSETSLAEKMREVSQLSQEKRKDCIQKSQRWISKYLNWNEVTHQVLEIYKQVLN